MSDEVISSEERLRDLTRAYKQLRGNVNNAESANALAQLSIAMSMLEDEESYEEDEFEGDEDEEDEEEF